MIGTRPTTLIGGWLKILEISASRLSGSNPSLVLDGDLEADVAVLDGNAVATEFEPRAHGPNCATFCDSLSDRSTIGTKKQQLDCHASRSARPATIGNSVTPLANRPAARK